MRGRNLIGKRGVQIWPVLVALLLPGCAVRRTTRINPSQIPPAPLEASPADLVARINAQNEAIRTLTAIVDLEPTAGSVYSGVIKEYHDVKGFILLKKPAMIRIQGQAPIVRTEIFDMVSDGEEFRLYIPPKQKFIVGKTAFRRPAKNALENLRPQHIEQALMIPGIDRAHERYFTQEEEASAGRFFVVTVLESSDTDELTLKRKIWLDRSNLQIARLQLYGANGTYIEDVHYSDYRDFQGVNYPGRIEVSRPIEDYRLTINIQKATFNEPIAPEKFELKKPENAQLVDLSAARKTEDPGGQ